MHFCVFVCDYKGVWFNFVVKCMAYSVSETLVQNSAFWAFWCLPFYSPQLISTTPSFQWVEYWCTPILWVYSLKVSESFQFFSSFFQVFFSAVHLIADATRWRLLFWKLKHRGLRVVRLLSGFVILSLSIYYFYWGVFFSSVYFNSSLCSGGF